MCVCFNDDNGVDLKDKPYLIALIMSEAAISLSFVAPNRLIRKDNKRGIFLVVSFCGKTIQYFTFPS